MQPLPRLKPGDTVELVAPASRCSDELLAEVKAMIESWQLKCIVSEDIFGPDILCANTDAARLNFLKNAFARPDTKAIICARGGYGSMRLIPELEKLPLPKIPKLFLGMSDITALHLFLQQKWQWPTLHGALSPDNFSKESIAAQKAFLFGETEKIQYQGIPLNKLAKKNLVIEAPITGGNLCLVQTSLGTTWQIDARNKILFLEEVNERGFRIDRMLEHLRQANVFQQVKAIILGDFTKGQEPDGTSLVEPVLERFAEAISIPVIKIQGIGHDKTNHPLALGVLATLQLGDSPQLIFQR